jgi:2-dehydro-3-deoxy-L-rhamnonate dehydrogenase (NAD+)
MTEDENFNGLRLTGRVALITGGAGGLGFAIAELLGKRGAAVALFDSEPSRLRSASEQLRVSGLDVLACPGDVTRQNDCDRAIQACVDRWNRLDILVNGAGIGGRNAPIWEIESDDWMRVIGVNLNGTYHMTKAAVPAMLRRGYGRIVNIASMAGKEGNANSSHYSASKAGIIGLTKSVGKELAAHGILVNAIAPAVVETDILKSQSPEHVAGLVAKIPMGRVAQPIEVARLVAFLASEDLSFSTGAVYDLSGGRATY